MADLRLAGKVWRRGRQPEGNISRARTVVSPKIFVLIISNGEKILRNVNVRVSRQDKRESSSFPVAVRPRLKNALA